MNVKKLMVLPLALLIFAWGAQGLSPVLAQESGQKVKVAPAAGQPKQESVTAPAATQVQERAPMEKVGHAGATFGKGTGNFFAKFGKGSGRFFKNAGVGTGRFFKRIFAGK
ncbi:MAG: hypothetical protein NTX71_00870 [Candidatus Aureabacteria bacterium]|nr:hypothetical protein [Candidatus Auribacterota bacterium]